MAFFGALIKGIWDAFPVTEGHLLLTPHRHIATWSDLHASEQTALIDGIETAKSLIKDRFSVDGFNVGFNEGEAAGQTIPHFHIHVIPRRRGDMKDPRGGVRHVIPAKGNYLIQNGSLVEPKPDDVPKPEMWVPHNRALISGGDDALIRHLMPHIDRASSVDVAVSFTMESGIRILRSHLQDLLNRDGRVRFITGDYLDVTDPDALRRLMDLEGEVSLHVFETGRIGFHPKSWIFHFADGTGVALVGSSNLSEMALRTGVEWNYRVFTPNQDGGWRDVLNGFEGLLARPEVKSLTHEWIDKYEKRRGVPTQTQFRAAEVEAEAELILPVPHLIQRRALSALEETRRDGYTAGMVVLATGLGKTWLSAFDSHRPEFKTVLFVAHREEILSQAMETFRVCRPKARLGRYTGTQKDLDADVLFASIQTLGKVAHLRNFAPDAFDYVVVDEFHHAAARTYRGLIDHFTPKFMIGLTATPERMDGGDLLGLCQENLVFDCDAFEGITSGLLSAFSYFGVPDDVDYANIPWRNAGFDEKALTAALATQARASNALEQHRKHAGQRTLAFCCSQLHADFMSEFFRAKGMRAVSVHSGKTSAPRTSSLDALQAGELDILFAVDMFNEGVDIPNIDTVLMLRPTESTTIWMQQFGRGLRRSEGKTRLNVIDYIGNHRIFLTKARALLNCNAGDRDLAIKLQQVRDGEFELPPGCSVTYDLAAMDLMQSLLRSTSQGDALEAFYIDFRLRFGERPTALEVFHAGFNPRTSGHGSWFEFVNHHKDISDQDKRVLAAHHEFLDNLSKTQMTKSYKMLLLKAVQQEGALPGALGIEPLTARFTTIAKRHPIYRSAITVPIDNAGAVRRLLEVNPIDALVKARGTSGRTFFDYKDGIFRTTFSVSDDLVSAFNAMTREVIDWRLAEYLVRASASTDAQSDHGFDGMSEPQTQFTHDTPKGPEVWQEYMREDIPKLYGGQFSTGSWNQGFVVQGNDVFILVTLDKSGLQDNHRYEDGFVDDRHLRWQSQNRTTQVSKHGGIISQRDKGYLIHLFVRPTKKRGSTATPFMYSGDVDFVEWEGNNPISVTWKLRNPVPPHMRRVLGLN
ncbi:DUF3427 domain-containing protein [Asticcacaulis sp. AC402]|uniref:DUF3427 domain-containing protein n=1 Tax=Asticcacaulis sp. AC402 TaxID=1282361 RepID=UPI0003C3C242|nr:DUF3427 domain-containing protein [Asticcacaulis sp. AC402]ESQ75492.1 hypothetical protein ABAC402_08175 [Asticcacaulis sp. AC402]